MNYQQAEDYIFGYTDYEKAPVPHDAANYDLRRMEELLDRLGNPHLGAKSVHIAGTKGKGSVAAMIASALVHVGYITGLYTSPHLHTWRERMRVDGELISEEEFVALVERVKPEVEAVNEKATYGQLTTFELLTALGFAFFEERGADFQVLEVGMGGNFDATNVIVPEVSIITSISLDHTEVLGSTLAEIAAEKAGIIKRGITVVTSPQSDEVVPVIEQACQKSGARLVSVGRDITWQNTGFDVHQQSLQVEGRLDTYELTIPLFGQYQMENAAVAVAALEILAGKGFRISKDDIIRGLSEVSWPGRLQTLRRSPLVVVDGAHNPDSARKLKQALEHYFGLSPVKSSEGQSRAILVIGVSSDKDIAGIASELATSFDKVIVTCSRHPRAMEPGRIVTEFLKFGADVQVAENVTGALSLALDMASEQDLVCVAGSLFIVGEAIEASELIG
jgi:dihydrofolate synthase/folylpolyglutamate synthase